MRRFPIERRVRSLKCETNGRDAAHRRRRTRRKLQVHLRNVDAPQRLDGRLRADDPPTADSLLIVDVLLTMVGLFRVDHLPNADVPLIADDRSRADRQPNRHKLTAAGLTGHRRNGLRDPRRRQNA